MPDQEHAKALQDAYEPHPDPVALTSPKNTSAADPSSEASPKNVSNVNYTPDPSASLSISPVRQRIIDAITGLYSANCSEEDIQVYARESVYDDPWSYCDTRYKIAGQWWGIPVAFKTSRTLATQVVESTPSTLIFKLQQEWVLKVLHVKHVSNSLVSLTLDPDPDQSKGKDTGAWKGCVKYHKDMWNEKDYSHEGIGKVMKDLNGDYLTGVTRPPKWL